MVIRKIPDLNLEQIADSGQCFYWDKTGENRYVITSGCHCMEVEQREQQFHFSCGEAEFTQFWSGYFDLNTDYGKLKRSVDPNDEYLQRAVEFGAGIRILRQDLWEVMVSFLISQNNNIARIRNSVRQLGEKYGECCGVIRGKEYYSFPSPDRLSGVTEGEYEALGLGYRAKYMKRLVDRFRNGKWEEFARALNGKTGEEMQKELLELYGIGEKVANCICLFGLYQINAFPIDTHIRSILNEHYPAGFPFLRYEGYLGIIQQYLFYYDLKFKK
ncbi:DNA-3-methyladenine glycosylase family protein [Anaerolentibacter hominis]|uniref:DNA-3-methyladenine glycosylase family protein n=1 Tax=Anaerolentibacter hominis TaxID=3079009 RepID=UPI0031B7F3A5